MFTDVMVDLETTGTDPAHNAIIQLAAVKFSLDRREVCTETFDKTMTFAPNRFWDEGGREFWQKMPDIYTSIVERAQDPGYVLQSFSSWLQKDVPDQEGGWRLWAKPITFEWAFLASYYKQYDIPMPFHYRYARDVNSYIAGLRGQAEHINLEDEIPFEGKKHDALWDDFHQIQVLFLAQERYGPVDG
jgi:DNA polymerase III epsilon subunit-like protein